MGGLTRVPTNSGGLAVTRVDDVNRVQPPCCTINKVGDRNPAFILLCWCWVDSFTPRLCLRVWIPHRGDCAWVFPANRRDLSLSFSFVGAASVQAGRQGGRAGKQASKQEQSLTWSHRVSHETNPLLVSVSTLNK